MRLKGGRTGVRALTVENLELTGLMKPFSLEVFYGERVAVLGSNGSGKSHFLRLLAGEDVKHTGVWKLGARVVPGHFAQTHAHPELFGRTLVDILWTEAAKPLGQAMGALRRYELERQAEQPFEKLSGGQQARFQILLLELAGTTALLLDEPTDNLDLESAEASRTVWSPTTGPCSASRTTGGSRAHSTVFWSSVRTVWCGRLRSPSGTNAGSSASARNGGGAPWA